MGAQIALQGFYLIKESKNEKVIICYGCIDDDDIAAGVNRIGSSGCSAHSNAGTGTT
jgi:hypothetical protein